MLIDAAAIMRFLIHEEFLTEVVSSVYFSSGVVPGTEVSFFIPSRGVFKGPYLSTCRVLNFLLPTVLNN